MYLKSIGVLGVFLLMALLPLEVVKAQGFGAG